MNCNVVTYYKNETRTRDLIPAKKDTIDCGSTTAVYEHRDYADLVIKKGSSFTVERDFLIKEKIGNHPNLVEHIALYKKIYPKSGKVKFKLLMKKIDGVILSRFNNPFKPLKPLEDKIIIKNIEQIRDLCLFLFNKQISWSDVNSRNIFITNEKQDIMIIDFEVWSEIKDSAVLCIDLLLRETRTIIENLITRCSSLTINYFLTEDEFQNTELIQKHSRLAKKVIDSIEIDDTELKKINLMKSTTDFEIYIHTQFDKVIQEFKKASLELSDSKKERVLF